MADSTELEKKVDKLLAVIEESNMATDHQRHHDYIEALIEKERLRAEVRRDLAKKLAVSGIWGGISATGYLLWLGFKDYFDL